MLPLGSGDTARYFELLSMLSAVSSVDFHMYKPAALRPRIVSRMLQCGSATLGEYVGFVASNPLERQALCRDLLLKCTSFFRSADVFETLGAQVFPRLMGQSAPPDDLVRIWVPACATGQEPYSLAMCLLESAEQLAKPRRFEILATDVDADVLQLAQAGLYSGEVAEELGPARMRQFCLVSGAQIQVGDEVRSRVRFARHDVLAEPPPRAELNLISCRNLLIYLEPNAQRHVLRDFHRALRPGGLLVLGNSESACASADLFCLLDASSKIYEAKPLFSTL